MSNITENPNVPSQIVGKVTFPKFMNTLGIIPTSYKDSMNYYENVAWLCKFLEETVIPTVNENGNAVQELQNLYVELNSYVSHYFDSLDVQEEINNKLDEMTENGTISALINNEIFNELNNKVLQNSLNIGNIREIANNAIKSTDTNVITHEMLSQEVKEELTGGNTAVVGVNSISNINLQNNSISINNLDKLLENTKTKIYENIQINYNETGFYRIRNNVLQHDNNNDFVTGKVQLTKGDIINITCYNCYEAVGFIVVDNENNIITSTFDGDIQNRFKSKSLTYKVNDNNLTAIISRKNTTENDYKRWNNSINLSKIKNLKNYSINSISNLEPLYDIPASMISVANLVVGTSGITIASNNNSSIKVYKISSGNKYKITSKNYSFVCGIAITDGVILSYASSTEVKSTEEPIEYEFIAENDSLVFLTEYIDTYHSIYPTIELINDISNLDTNNYHGINWACLGDSYTAKSTLGENVKNYCDYVGEKLNLTVTNLGVGGSGYYNNNRGNNAFWQRTNQIPTNSNIITIFGSFNDLFANDGDTLNIGNVDDTTTESVCGCINVTLNNILSRIPQAMIGIITPVPWKYRNPFSGNKAICEEYVSKLIQIAKNRSIPVLDLYHESNMKPYNDNFLSLFYIDDVHLNTSGHFKISSQIENFIKQIYL